MKKFILLFVIISSFISNAQEVQAYDMQSYLNDNGTLEYYSNVVDRMFDFMRQEFEKQKVEEEVWMEVNQIKGPAIDDIAEMIIKVYEGYFSTNEISKMLEFYGSETGQKISSKKNLLEKDLQQREMFYTSELGQKISEATPALNQTIQKVTQEWSADLYKNALLKLSEKGITKDE